MEEMTEKELITVLIDKYTDLQRIKKANNNVENEELEYQIRATTAKLSSMGVNVEELTLYHTQEQIRGRILRIAEEDVKN